MHIVILRLEFDPLGINENGLISFDVVNEGVKKKIMPRGRDIIKAIGYSGRKDNTSSHDQRLTISCLCEGEASQPHKIRSLIMLR